MRVDPDVSPATWVYKFAWATSTRLVRKGSAVKPAWAPDGSRLAFSRNADGRRFGLSVAPAAGTGEESALLPKSENSQFSWDWSKDGRWLLYSIVDPKTKEDLWVLPMQGNGPPEPFLVTDATETDGAFSPEIGRLIGVRVVGVTRDQDRLGQRSVSWHGVRVSPVGWIVCLLQQNGLYQTSIALSFVSKSTNPN